jgi:hypothetical protein
LGKQKAEITKAKAEIGPGEVRERLHGPRPSEVSGDFTGQGKQKACGKAETWKAESRNHQIKS